MKNSILLLQLSNPNMVFKFSASRSGVKNGLSYKVEKCVFGVTVCYAQRECSSRSLVHLMLRFGVYHLLKLIIIIGKLIYVVFEVIAKTINSSTWSIETLYKDHNIVLISLTEVSNPSTQSGTH